MYSLIWQSVMWRPGKGWNPHWREEARSLPGRPRRPDGAILMDHAVAAAAPSVGSRPSLRSDSGVISHPDCRSTPTLIAARHFGWKFSPGDRVMETQNDYEREVFNGDLGKVDRIDEDEGSLVVNFEGREVIYPF